MKLKATRKRGKKKEEKDLGPQRELPETYAQLAIFPIEGL